MSIKLTQGAIVEQTSLIHQLEELEALIEVCRCNQHLNETHEGEAVRRVLMMATNSASQLVTEQTSKLDWLNTLVESQEGNV